VYFYGYAFSGRQMDAHGPSLFPNRLASSLDEKSRSKASQQSILSYFSRTMPARAPDHPIKDPSKHTSARVRKSYRGQSCDA
jgi:hypothetical protein